MFLISVPDHGKDHTQSKALESLLYRVSEKEVKYGVANYQYFKNSISM